MKSNLIDEDSPLYKSRMVRELNALPDGFYAWIGWSPDGETGPCMCRCTRARVRGGDIQVRAITKRPSRDGFMWAATCQKPNGKHPQFEDAYGREVCASRKP